MTYPETMTIFADRRRINIALWGDPERPAVLLIHGLRDHARSWDMLAADLAHDYRVIVPDLRGHGDSDWAGTEGYSLAAYVADMADVVEALDLAEFALIGHSLGGAIALRLAAAMPERAVALAGIECVELPIQREEADAPEPYPQRLRTWLDRRRAFGGDDGRRYASMAEATARMLREQADLPSDTVEHMARHALVFEQGKGWRWKFDPRVRLRPPEDQRAHDLDEVLDAVSCPVLLCYADSGWIPLPAEARLARLKAHAVSHYTDAGHWLHHQFPERFAQEVRTLLHFNCRNSQDA